MKKVLTLLVAVMISFAASAQYKAPKIIAHRGFHASEGAARNSLNALKAAQEAKIWGSECDIQLTKDGEVLVVHGPSHPGNKNAKPRVNVNYSTKETRRLDLTFGVGYGHQSHGQQHSQKQHEREHFFHVWSPLENKS